MFKYYKILYAYTCGTDKIQAGKSELCIQKPVHYALSEQNKQIWTTK